jgi:hypothetical protein
MGCRGQGGDQLRLGVRQRVSRGRGCESRCSVVCFVDADDRSCVVGIKSLYASL